MKWMPKFLFLAAALLASDVRAEDDAKHGVWGLAYFRQRYPTRVEIDADGKIRDVPLPDPMSVEQLHFALSTDGRNWTPLKGNEPVWTQQLRDPFIHRAPDGVWHLMGTGRAAGDTRKGRGPVCIHATSRDLINWNTVESLPLMDGVTWTDGRKAQNIWAPEWFFDEKAGEFFVFWSSSFEDAGWKDSRLWFSRTKDWKTFTTAKLLFDPDYSVIDGTLREVDGTYYLFHKEEEFGERTGERRAIRLATSKNIEGPYEILQGPLNKGQIVPTITEGCSIMPDPTESGWLLLYDYCMTNRFGASSSPDLKNWKVLDEVKFPPDARHGSAFQLKAGEAERLKKQFPSPTDGK